MIETERLLIRHFLKSDAGDLHEYLSNPVTYIFEPGEPLTPERAEELAVQRAKGDDFLAVVLKSSRKMIGHLYFKQIEPAKPSTWELGYIFNPAFQQRGFAAEASAALVEYAFKNYETYRIIARCDPDNRASWRLLESIGFTREGHFKKAGFVHTDEEGNRVWTDVYEYAKIKE